LSQRIRCQRHTINLIVEVFLFIDAQLKKIESYDKDTLDNESNEQTQAEREEAFRAMNVLDKLHNIIIHTRSSTDHINEFLSLTERRISLNNFTR
jgi:hypothetical protein